AAGLELDAGRVAAFRAALIECVRERMGATALRPEFVIDVEARIEDLPLDALEALSDMEPHGPGNAKPMVLLRGVRLSEPPRIVGSGGHLRLMLSDRGRTLQAIGFGQARHAGWIRRHAGAFDVIGQPSINEYNSRRSPQLEIKDIRPAGQ
ncbi:MAG: hypothetical protein NTW86_24490, partial [Candidatus Sumerlaeota bacterium]|nr:hypothetical protein [Candidatus Sumerlaeota bacterium]